MSFGECPDLIRQTVDLRCQVVAQVRSLMVSTTALTYARMATHSFLFQKGDDVTAVSRVPLILVFHHSEAQPLSTSGRALANTNYPSAPA